LNLGAVASVAVRRTVPSGNGFRAVDGLPILPHAAIGQSSGSCRFVMPETISNPRRSQAGQLIDLLDQPAFLVDDRGRAVEWNEAGARVLFLDGAGPERLSDAAALRLKRFSDLIECAAGPFMLTLPASDGERTYGVTPPLRRAGSGPHVLLLQDETVLIQEKRALWESEQRFKAIARAALDAMVVMDAFGRVRFWNRAAEQIFGWSASEALGKKVHELLAPPTQLNSSREGLNDWAREGASHMFERVQRLRARHRDGHEIDIELALVPIRQQGHWQAFGIIRDVTAQAREEERIREAEARWQFALEGGGDAVWDWNIVSGGMLFGPRYKAMLGYGEHEFENTFEGFFARLHPDDQARVSARLDEAIRDRTCGYRCDFRMRCGDGDYRWIHSRGLITERDAAGQPTRMVGTNRDITEQRAADLALQQQLAETQRLNMRLEEMNIQLLQSEKMASLGQLAAGVAHEMNTPLGFVGSNLGTLKTYVEKLFWMTEQCLAGDGDAERIKRLRESEAADIAYFREDLPGLFRETKDGIDRLSRIVSDLRDFSRVGDQTWEYCDLHQCLDSTLNILRNELKHKATVVREYGQLPQVWCVASQLNQVFLNLLVNASHAIDVGGTITVRTRTEERGVRVDVSDTGCGIEPANLRRIFEPFFTTKPVGRGTGLGLSIAYGIVQKHGGRFEVKSTIGIGSQFSVWLPENGREGSLAGPDAGRDSGVAG
jgi:two-component system, NtrC family, sensor kinase